MGSTSMIIEEVVAPTSPVEVAPTGSATCRGMSTLRSTTSGEVALPSIAPHGGVAVCASSASTSPTTLGSSDLVRDGEAGAPWSPCGATAGLRVSNTTSIREQIARNKDWVFKILHHRDRDAKLGPKWLRLNPCKHPCPCRSSSSLRL
jgi:hypothetical protein